RARSDTRGWATRAVNLSAKAIESNARSNELDMALALLDKHALDGGLRVLTPVIEERAFFIDEKVLEHLAEIDQPEAARLLTELAKHSTHEDEVTRLFKTAPMNKYAEDALLAKLNANIDLRMNERRTLIDVLGEVATKKSSAYVTELLTDSDVIIKRRAAEIIAVIDPKVNDAAERFMRAVASADSRTSIWRELSDLAASPPEEGDPRRAEVSQALVKYAQGGDRRVDHRLLGALAQWGDASAMPVYMELLEDERAPRQYVKTVIQLAGEHASDAQASETADAIGNWFLLETDAVADALIAMGKHGEAPAIKHLKAKQAEVRMGCIKVISEVGTTKGLSALRGMGRDPDTSVRETARQAYYDLRDKIKEQSGS
ncbi:MAG: hypothetical protein AAF085_17875, partial [Planctomycetota bacterium]